MRAKNITKKWKSSEKRSMDIKYFHNRLASQLQSAIKGVILDWKTGEKSRIIKDSSQSSHYVLTNNMPYNNLRRFRCYRSLSRLTQVPRNTLWRRWHFSSIYKYKKRYEEKLTLKNGIRQENPYSMEDGLSVLKKTEILKKFGNLQEIPRILKSRKYSFRSKFCIHFDKQLSNWRAECYVEAATLELFLSLEFDR